MNILRNLLILSLTLFVLIGCGEEGDEPQTSPPVNDSASDTDSDIASDTTSDSGDGDVVVPEVATEVASGIHNNEEESSLVENNNVGGPSPAVIEASAKVADRSQAIGFEGSSNSFIVVNRLPFTTVSVAKAEIENPVVNTLFSWCITTTYKVFKHDFLGSKNDFAEKEGCVEVPKTDIKNIRIYYTTKAGGEKELCALGRCKAEHSEIILTEDGKSKLVPARSLRTGCKVLD